MLKAIFWSMVSFFRRSGLPSACDPCSTVDYTHSAEPARTIPLNAENWSFQTGTVEFLPSAPAIGGVTPQGPAMKIIGRNGGAVVAKNTDFSEGVIDFDIQPTDSNFASFYFHRQDAMETECFYFRTGVGCGPSRYHGGRSIYSCHQRGVLLEPDASLPGQCQLSDRMPGTISGS